MPFLVTNSGLTIYDGSVVILSRHPNVKWLIRYGWYTYQNKQYDGWFFSSIPANDIMPMSEIDSSEITIVSGPCCCPADPVADPDILDQIDRTWITVDTIEQRNLLSVRLIPDGRIVRVNKDVDGKTHYYSYDEANSVWVEEQFGLDEIFVSKSELLEDVDNLINDSETIRESVSTIAKNYIRWHAID